MSVSRSLLYLLFAATLVFGCQNSGSQSTTSASATSPTREIKIIADTSVAATVRSYASTAWCGENLSGTYVSGASSIYRYENCDEVMETLEIVDVKEGLDDNGNTVSAAFLRYSIGTKVFRNVLWFRKVGDRYARAGDHPSTYSDEEDWSEEAMKIAEEADSWEEESTVWYE